MLKTLEVTLNYPYATQYYAVINQKIHNKLGLQDCDYVEITFEGKRLITKCCANTEMPKGFISLHTTTHNRTLDVANKDKVMIRKYTEVINDERIEVTVKCLRVDRRIQNPFIGIGQELYVEPGYYISCKQGLCLVESGIGLYKCLAPDPIITSEIQSQSQSKTVSLPLNLVNFEEIESVSNMINIDFCHMGIGGLKEQMSRLIREVFISRIIPEQMRKKYDVILEKGILLYGPPGTGKTLIAKNIGKIIPNTSITIVNGPELSSKYFFENDIFERTHINCTL